MKDNMYVYTLVLCVIFLTAAFCVPEEQLTNYENLYELGMEAYKDGEWKKCTSFFSNALKAHHYYTNTVIDCRLKCKKEVSSSSDKNSASTFELFFYDIILTSDCLRRCKKIKFGQNPDLDVSHTTNKKFEDRTPYNYLQFCFFKQNLLKEAAAAAYTYYITHQEDDAIIGTLQYYRGLSKISSVDFIDQERKPYQESYIKALEAYNDGNWKESTARFEEALELYYMEEERCRAGCEKGFTHNGVPDFINAIADHYVTVMVCQQKCLQKLHTFGMKQIDNYVEDHYNYLQYAYYESGRMTTAFEAIANFLLFKPKDHEMLGNKQYYLKTLRRKEHEFVPSQKVEEYVQLWQTIDRSLDFIRDHYTLPSTVVVVDPEEEAMAVHAERRDRLIESFTKLGVRIAEDFKLVEGQRKYAMDGLIREDQCQAIADLARMQEIDEYGVRKISVSQAIGLVKKDEDSEICLRLLLRASEMINAFTSVYFNHSQMFIQESKVVCRAAGEHWGEKLDEECILQEDGTCMEDGEKPEFMVASFLTDVSDGTGEFFFMDENYESKYRLSPQCGRVIGFAGSSLHGVDLSDKHERCAIVISLSTEEDNLNPALKEAKAVLANLAKKHVEDMETEDRDDILDQFYSQGVTIAKTGEDLLGKERFAADGLSTEAECSQLINLAKRSAVTGDGYYGNVSPLSDGEIFAGLSISHAEKAYYSPSTFGKTFGRVSNSLDLKKTLSFLASHSDPSCLLFVPTELIDTDEASAHMLQLLLDLSDHARLLVEKYFNLARPLYFDYTHLVCRTAVEGYTHAVEELSHPVHSDNCMIQPNGSCLPDKLAYVQRHYSAIMYLNDDFEGGEFFFAHKNKSEQISLAPQCGRLVAFNASDYHGVKGVRKGQRCAIAMWYTHDPNYIEVSRIHAQRRLDKMFGKREPATVGSEDITMNDAIAPEPFLEDTNDHDEL